jgi:hypothetical protein
MVEVILKQILKVREKEEAIELEEKGDEAVEGE